MYVEELGDPLINIDTPRSTSDMICCPRHGEYMEIFLRNLSAFVISIYRATNYGRLRELGQGDRPPRRSMALRMVCGNCVRAHKHRRRLLITHRVIGFLTSAFVAVRRPSLSASLYKGDKEGLPARSFLI